MITVLDAKRLPDRPGSSGVLAEISRNIADAIEHAVARLEPQTFKKGLGYEQTRQYIITRGRRR